jgi:hypothetical protein
VTTYYPLSQNYTTKQIIHEKNAVKELSNVCIGDEHVIESEYSSIKIVYFRRGDDE